MLGCRRRRRGVRSDALLDKAETSVLFAEGHAEEAVERSSASSSGAGIGLAQPSLYAPWRSDARARARPAGPQRGGTRRRRGGARHRPADGARRGTTASRCGCSATSSGSRARASGGSRRGAGGSPRRGSSTRKRWTRVGARLRRDRSRPTRGIRCDRRWSSPTSGGARPLVDESRAEIYATGARPRTTALQGVAALTSSEQRVAALAAEGNSNRDIAQALYVTPKTVEVHLSSTAYSKLRDLVAERLDGALDPRFQTPGVGVLPGRRGDLGVGAPED